MFLWALCELCGLCVKEILITQGSQRAQRAAKQSPKSQISKISILRQSPHNTSNPAKCHSNFCPTHASFPRMIDKRNTNRRYNWTETPREKKESRWSKLYASITREGTITLSKFTYESMGSPDSYLLLYDADLNVLGLQPARFAVTKNAYPVTIRDRRGACRIFAQRMIREHSLYLDETVWFPRCFIDSSGTLILELNDVRATRKSKRSIILR